MEESYVYIMHNMRAEDMVILKKRHEIFNEAICIRQIPYYGNCFKFLKIYNYVHIATGDYPEVAVAAENNIICISTEYFWRFFQKI